MRSKLPNDEKELRKLLLDLLKLKKGKSLTYQVDGKNITVKRRRYFVY